VPRELVEKKYVLEESKKWAKTIAARVGVRAAPVATAAGVGAAPDSAANFVLIQTVLNEIIDTVYVLEFLTGFAKRMGLFDFDLRSLLVNFLGDVQVVAEFGRHRQTILEKFNDIMDKVGTETDEIYIVAHSEGTVVAVLGLLQALAEPFPPEWTTRVRGLMTIGSPVEVHLLLWPELWNGIPDQVRSPGPPIVWRNYLDSGDPIAYSLKKTEDWLARFETDDNPPKAKFDFNEHEFCRYPFPGKAHIDYWADDKVFGHFIQTVMKEQPRQAAGQPRTLLSRVYSWLRSRADRDYSQPPTSKFGAQLLSYTLPYTLLLAVLLAAVYVVYRPVLNAMTEPSQAAAGGPTEMATTERSALVRTLASTDAHAAVAPETQRPPEKYRWDWDNRSSQRIFLDVLGFALLIGGLTVMVRLPRLAPSAFWRLVAFFAFVVGSVAYWLIATDVTREAVGRPLEFASLVSLLDSMLRAATAGVIGVAAVVAITCAFLGVVFPHWGVRTLPILGGIASVWLIGSLIAGNVTEMNLWPLVLGVVLFLYLWWLFALLVDLVFVWHRYVRHGAAVEVLRVGHDIAKASPSSQQGSDLRPATT
jgi:hypothetical protein